MKKVILGIWAFTWVLSGCAPASGNMESGGYPPMSLEQALQQPDGTQMRLAGQFVSRVGNEEDEFIFREVSGGTLVVYDPREGREVRLGVDVVIEGEIDREYRVPEFNLHRVLTGRDPMPAAVAPRVSADGVFIHLSRGAESPRRVGMALTMAATYAGDHPVLLYADVDAVALFVEDAPVVAPEGYVPASERVPALLAAGVRLRVCPTCLAAAGLAPKDLIEGVEVADKQEFLTFAPGRILSFSY